MACCSRRSSLVHVSSQSYYQYGRENWSVHGLVDLVNIEVAVNLLHSTTSVLHGIEGLFVDVGRLNRLDFALDGHDLI